MLRLVLSAAVLVLVLVIDSISCFCVRLGNTIDKTTNVFSLIAEGSRGHRDGSDYEHEHRRCATEHEHDGYWPEQGNTLIVSIWYHFGKITRRQSISRNAFSCNYRQFLNSPKPEQLGFVPKVMM